MTTTAAIIVTCAIEQWGVDMKKFLTAAVLASNLFFMPISHAEIKTYEGTDEYIMSEFETMDIAKQRAKQKAMRAAQEQAGVFVESSTDVVNMVVTKDEIHTLTAGILNVSNVSYSQEALSNVNGFIIRATVTALVDTDDIAAWLNRPAGERADLVAKNIELKAALAAQDAKIAELKKQLADKPQDKAIVAQQFAAEDKVFLSNQQLSEAGKLYYKGDLSGAVNLCTRAIELDSSNATAYSIRGAIYYRLNDFNSALADFNKAIEFNASDYKTFYNRGLAYVKLDNYRAAAQDFTEAINRNPNDADSWHNRGLCRQRLGDMFGAQSDLNKARSLS